MADKIQTAFDQPDFSGYLKKKGGNIKMYRKRWFELRGQNLYYYKQQNQKKPAGVIVVSNTKIVDDPSRKFSFKICGDTLTRVFELTAETEADKQNWMAELIKSLKTQQKGNNNPQSPASSAQGAGSFKQAAPAKKETEVLFSKHKDKKPAALEDFEFLTVVGRGSFGKVVKVRKRDTRQIYAMKILRKDMIVKENMISHTKAEKQILQSIEHPFIVGLHYAFQTPEKLYLVLDFLSGGELFYHLKEETKFDVDRAKIYTAEIILALEHLHKNDIIYRDLKPENIVLDPKGHICLTDFGLAKTCITNATPTYTFCGTPEYLAPEILKGQGHAKAVDWWSLGVLLYEMLVGLPPFYSENINEMYELILKAPLKFPAFVPQDAQSILRGLLEREEFKRLGSGPTDAAEIRAHPFFRDIDWEKLYRKEYVMPFIPNIKDGDDTKYFDPEFTNEAAKDSFAEVVEDGDDKFDDFYYNRHDK